MSKNIKYKYVLNKIFTGSFLNYNLGHEIINFIKMDDGNRYIYVNPWGERCEESARDTEYVLHIMKTTYKTKTYYELVAVSKVAKDDVGYMKKGEDETNDLKFRKISVRKIFEYNNFDNKSHLCTFKAKAFYKPKKGIRVLFMTGQSKVGIREVDDGVVIVNLNCNPQHSRAYSRDVDIKVLDEVVVKYLKLNNETEAWNQYDDELCYSIICDRTKLEDSTSNQIAYFLNRDSELANLFVKKFLKLNIKDKKFSIIREKNNIDLFIESDNAVIVIENKIDSGLHGNQLKNYKEYIRDNYSNKEAYFYILEPSYSSITEKDSDGYNIVYYDDLYKVISSSKYKPNGKTSDYGDFLYKEFKYTIEYIQMSKAAQQEKIAYTRLKQRINELEVRK